MYLIFRQGILAWRVDDILCLGPEWAGSEINDIHSYYRIFSPSYTSCNKILRFSIRKIFLPDGQDKGRI
jgi:hypothetical protein